MTNFVAGRCATVVVGAINLARGRRYAPYGRATSIRYRVVSTGQQRPWARHAGRTRLSRTAAGLGEQGRGSKREIGTVGNVKDRENERGEVEE